jgi:putative ABC transport system permease protein
VMPMLDIHLSSNAMNELEPNGSKTLVVLLAIVGVIIITTAWINYINLETSRFVTRIRSFGVRRIVGAGKSDLAAQFMVEYFCLTFLAMSLSAQLAPAMISEIPGLSGISLWNSTIPDSKTWLVAISFFLFGSVLVGVWPALVALKFNPVAALKGKISAQTSRAPVREGLVVFQFVASLVLLGFVFAVATQVEFMDSSNKGVELETVIALRNATAYSGQETSEKFGEFSRLEQKLRQHPGISHVATSSAIPGTEVGFTYVNMIKRNAGDPYDPTPYKTVFANEEFIATYGLQLLAGENFSKPRDYSGAEPWTAENWASIILNERAVRLLGFDSPEDAVNKEVYYRPFDDELKCRIIGVLKDYHHEAIKREIYPTIFFHNYSSFQQVYFSVRMSASMKPSDVLAYIGDSWKEIFPDRPFEYFFLDDFYDRQFKEERRFMSIFSTFAVVAVFIACLGILGMALNESNSRLKELSIRKVLGATTSNLVLLLSRRNLRTLAISLGIATPLIYVVVQQWLSIYPVRIDFSFLFIVVPLLIILTMVTVVSGFQTMRSANSSPLDHLKGE